ncbi:hypothetical protein AA15669_1213 [Saccharibacter floricola DSM 15669]|uniref:Uncharacterized protein n=1 Tax=Saccharibacter floricola DSM 15669 TaxID=1123227 RepID=A0ABQ0NZI9_9PROT|nr:hypothetical protein AA15669_1213 [Saccharibacter floricola DSM 15669]
MGTHAIALRVCIALAGRGRAATADAVEAAFSVAWRDGLVCADLTKSLGERIRCFILTGSGQRCAYTATTIMHNSGTQQRVWVTW